MVLFLLLSLPIQVGAIQKPPKNASSAVIIDAHSSRVLWGYHMDDEREMASTTKIMTAIVAIENGCLSDIVTADSDTVKVEGSSIWLEEGEQLTLEALLYGLMLSSGNDAAETIAKHVGGTEEQFIQMMNEKASELGMTHSHFENPHGLHHENHYTSARDLAVLAAYALRNETFKTITSTQKKRIDWPGHEWDRVLNNKNKLLKQLDGAIGVKTGYTKKAGRCLVAAAEREDERYVAVVLNCGPMFEDCTSMIEYAFATYDMIDVNGLIRSSDKTIIQVDEGYQESVELQWENDLFFAVDKTERQSVKIEINTPNQMIAPIEKGQKYGEVKVYIDQECVRAVPLTASKSIQRKNILMNLKIIVKKLYK